MDPTNIVVGFGGALIGAGTTTLLFFADRGHRRKIAGRAVHNELTINATYLGESLAERPVPGLVRDEMWRAFIRELADLLPHDESPISAQ